jgi:hypothetical protein
MQKTTDEITEETKPTGRQPFTPTPEQQDTVRAMASYGIPQDHIAKHLGIAPKTLRKRFRSELKHGAYDANNAVLASLFKMATTRHNVAAAIFWARARCGFRPGCASWDTATGAGAPKRKKLEEEFPKVSTLTNLHVYNNEGEPNADY